MSRKTHNYSSDVANERGAPVEDTEQDGDHPSATGDGKFMIREMRDEFTHYTTVCHRL